MERVLKRFAIVVGLGGAGLIAVISIAPHGEAAFIIQRFQTLFGGVLATIAAAFTAYVVYRSAALPARMHEARLASERIEKEKVYAAMISSALQRIVYETTEGLGRTPAMRGEPILPPILKDPEAISHLRPEHASKVSGVVTNFEAMHRRDGLYEEMTRELLFDHACTIRDELHTLAFGEEER